MMRFSERPANTTLQTRMERIDSINPERLAWCCADAAIAPEQLAAATLVPLSELAPVLARKEAASLTFAQLSRIAAHFGRDVLFFVEPGPVVTEQVRSQALQMLSSQKSRLRPALKRIIEHAEKQRIVFMALRDEFTDANLPRFAPPTFVSEDYSHMAHTVRRWLGLANPDSFDSYRSALGQQGILVFCGDEHLGPWQYDGDSPVLGFSLYDEQVPLIVVKRHYPVSEQLLVLIHSLAHLLLHRHATIDDESSLRSHHGDEGDANALARHILVPDAYLADISDWRQPREVGHVDDWLLPQQRAWNVSADLILRRLVDAKRMSEEKYEEYAAWRRNRIVVHAARSIKQSPLDELKQKYGDAFVTMVLDALDRGYITLPKASSYLDGLTLDDLHALERSYADY